MVCHLLPWWTWLLVTARRLVLLLPDTLTSVLLWSSPGVWSHSVRPDSAQCCNRHKDKTDLSVATEPHSSSKRLTTQLIYNVFFAVKLPLKLLLWKIPFNESMQRSNLMQMRPKNPDFYELFLNNLRKSLNHHRKSYVCGYL